MLYLDIMVNKIKTFIILCFIRISIALRNVDEELKAKASDLIGSARREFKKRTSNPVLRKMEDGQADERYNQQFYEILKKADEIVRSTNPDKAAKLADKHGVNIGAKDKWGRRWDHHGFLDPKHKHYGKTLKEIRDLEIVERKSIDDDYPVVAMFQNKTELSFLDTTKVIKSENDVIAIPHLHEVAKLYKYPLGVSRKNDVIVNKIERLTDFLHVKSVTSKHYILEFFIPLKFKTFDIPDTDSIFGELCDIDQVWFNDEYGDSHWYKITEFYKRSGYKEFINDKKEKKFSYEIWKFKAEIIEKIN